MRTRMIVIALCLVMVSAFAVTGAVSAAQTDNTATQQFDVKSGGTGTTMGKLTIDTTSGYYAVNVNWAKKDPQAKAEQKDAFREAQYTFDFSLYNTQTRESVLLGSLAVSNKGGTIHGEGTLDPTLVSPDDLAKIAGWNPDDVVVGWVGLPNP